MTRWIVGSSLRAKRGVVLVAALLFGFGVWQLRDASLDALPEFSPTTVEVQTEALGLSAEEMEQLITVPLEQDLLNGVAWMESIRSQSVPGLSSIVMEFEPGTDLYRARQVVQERLNEAHALPNVSKVPAMLQPQSSTSRALMISLSSEELTPIQLGVLARWNIVPRLTGVSGVANVVIWGQKERQLQVQVDPQRLADNGVTLDQVIATTGNALWASPLSFLEASTPGTGGFIDMNNQRLGVQHLSPIKNAEQLSQVVIEQADATAGAGGDAKLRLGDVADVVEDHQPLIGEANVKGGEGLILVVEKLPNTDTKAVTAGVEDAMESLRPGLTGVDIDTGIYRPATYIDKSGDNLFRSMVFGGALLLIGLLAFVISWRRAVIMVVGIAFSLLGAGLVLYWRESTFNAIVMAGLIMALGAVIDDATVSVDNTARRLRQQATGDDEPPPATSIILEATLESAAQPGLRPGGHGPGAPAALRDGGSGRRLVLPAPGHLVPHRRGRLAPRGAHGDSGPQPPVALESRQRPGSTSRAGPARRLSPALGPRGRSSAGCHHRRCGGRRRGHRHLHPARSLGPAATEGDGSPRPVERRAGYLAAGDEPGHRSSRRGAPDRSRRPQRGRSHRAGHRWRSGRWCEHG